MRYDNSAGERLCEGTGKLDLQRLSDWGYRYGVIDLGASRTTVQRGRDFAFKAGTLLKSCSDYEVYQLPPPQSNRTAPVHPSVNFQAHI